MLILYDIDSGYWRSNRKLLETLRTRLLKASRLFYTHHVHLQLLMLISDKLNAGLWQRRDGVRDQETKALLRLCPDDVTCVLGFGLFLYSRWILVLALSRGSYRSSSIACYFYVPVFHVDLNQTARNEKLDVVDQRFCGKLRRVSKRFACGYVGIIFGWKGFTCKLLQTLKHSLLMLACKYEFLSQEVQIGNFIRNDHMRHEVQKKR